MRNGVAGAVGVGAVGGGEQPIPEFVRRGISFLRGSYSHPVAAHVSIISAGQSTPFAQQVGASRSPLLRNHSLWTGSLACAARALASAAFCRYTSARSD